jgi:hypothetical protein
MVNANLSNPFVGSMPTDFGPKSRDANLSNTTECKKVKQKILRIFPNITGILKKNHINNRQLFTFTSLRRVREYNSPLVALSLGFALASSNAM